MPVRMLLLAALLWVPQAQEETSGYDAEHYRIEIKIDDKTPEITGKTTMTVKVTADKLDALPFHAEGLTFRLISVGGKPALFSATDGRLVVKLGRFAAKGETLTVSAEYSATPKHGLFRVGPDEGYPKKPWMVWTQGETEYARYWFPCWDLPADKATTEVFATVKSAYTTVSNGALVSEKESGGWKTYHWKQEKPHATYLVTLVAGDFERVEEEVAIGDRKIPLHHYVARGQYDLADVKRTFSKTAAMVRHFSEKTGVAYPWGKYAQVCVYDFIWGGMENTSATTLHQFTVIPARGAMDRDSDGLISHELAHQWFGDVATCRTWSETWLNEGFATYLSSIWAERERGEEGYSESMWGTMQSGMGGERQRPIVWTRYENPLDMFDNFSYGKGACVLHMLRAVVGDEAFWGGVKRYLTDRAFQPAATKDLQIAMESSAGRPLDWFFDQWLFKTGFPDLEVTTAWDAALKVLRVKVRQKQEGTVFRIPAELEIDSRLYRVEADRAEQELLFPLDAEPKLVLFDPRGRVLKKLAQGLSAEQLEAVVTKSPHVWARRWAVEQIQDATVLKRVLLEDKVALVQVGAAQALKDADALLACVRLENPRARWAVFEALGRFSGRDDVVAALEKAADVDLSPNCRATAWTALGKLGRVEALLKAAESLKDDEWVLPGVFNGLVETGDERVVPVLVARTKYGVHPWIRQRATAMLGEFARRKPSAPAVSRLTELVSDAAFRIRAEAAGALKTVGDAAAADALEKRAAIETDGRMIRNLKQAAEAIRARTK